MSFAVPGLSFTGTSSDKNTNFFGEDIGYVNNNQDTDILGQSNTNSNSATQSQNDTLSQSQSSNQTSGSQQTQQKGTTQYGKVTESGISSEGLNFMLNSLLGSTNGLAQLLTGEKGSGVYDSATTALLSNQLVANLAGQVAERNVTTKESGQDVTSQAGSETNQQNSIANAISSIFNTGNQTNQSNSNTTSSQDTKQTGQTTHDIVNQGHQETVDNTTESKGGSVVCTHLHSTGQLSTRIYYKNAMVKENKYAMRGYRFWAVPYVKRMRRGDWISRLMEKMIFPLVTHRANFLHDGRWSVLGFVVQYILRPINICIGLCVKEKDYAKILYSAEKKEKFA